jgi:hypothetical protein
LRAASAAPLRAGKVRRFGIPFRSPLDNVKHMTNIIPLIEEDVQLTQQLAPGIADG